MNNDEKIQYEGRLEEYRALRAEMLSIISGRLWGQVTYAAMTAGVLSFAGNANKDESLIFLIFLSIPFLSHTIFREHARIRMANYMRLILEPRIPGLYWEEYLGRWRSFRGKPGGGWLSTLDRLKHIFALSGLFALVSLFCWILLLQYDKSGIHKLLASIGIFLVFFVYLNFFFLYDKGAQEIEQIKTELKRIDRL